jgi:NAD(P)-dependent dehydrogenase (short-subunit alcohol dehydrogenase family)
VSSESDAEGAGGTVADALRNLGYTALVTAQQVLRECHAPGEQIFHRRDADRAAKALEERRARERSFLRKLGDCPGVRRTVVQTADRGREPTVREPAHETRTPAELTPVTTVREIFETNTFGTIAMMQAVIPQFRQRKAGVIVNVTSSVTLKVLPLIAAYRASKMAVNAFTESTALELEPFGVRVRLVLPGRSPETRFGENARSHMHGFDHEAYVDLVQKVFAGLTDTASPITRAQDVAEAVWRAANDPSSPMRIPAGADAEAWAAEAR